MAGCSNSNIGNGRTQLIRIILIWTHYQRSFLYNDILFYLDFALSKTGNTNRRNTSSRINPQRFTNICKILEFFTLTAPVKSFKGIKFVVKCNAFNAHRIFTLPVKRIL